MSRGGVRIKSRKVYFADTMIEIAVPYASRRIPTSSFQPEFFMCRNWKKEILSVRHSLHQVPEEYSTLRLGRLHAVHQRVTSFDVFLALYGFYRGRIEILCVNRLCGYIHPDLDAFVRHLSNL